MDRETSDLLLLMIIARIQNTNFSGEKKLSNVVRYNNNPFTETNKCKQKYNFRINWTQLDRARRNLLRSFWLEKLFDCFSSTFRVPDSSIRLLVCWKTFNLENLLCIYLYMSVRSSNVITKQAYSRCSMIKIHILSDIIETLQSFFFFFLRFSWLHKFV